MSAREVVGYVVREGKVRGEGRYEVDDLVQISHAWTDQQRLAYRTTSLDQAKRVRVSAGGARVVRLVKRAAPTVLICSDLRHVCGGCGFRWPERSAYDELVREVAKARDALANERREHAATQELHSRAGKLIGIARAGLAKASDLLVKA